MADKYIDSAATGGSNNGTSWANAYLTFADAAAADSAGDVFYVKNTHSESTASAVSLNWAGTTSNPVKIICVSDSNEPPTTTSTGALVATTGASNIIVCSAGYLIVYGVIFQAGDSTNNASVLVNNSTAIGETVLIDCALRCNGSGTSSRVTVTGGGTLTNCTFKFANSSQGINPGELTVLNGCSFEAGSTAISTLLASLSSGYIVRIRGCDLSGGSSAMNFATASSIVQTELIVSNCKMPSSWSGSIISATPGAVSCFLLTNCDSSDTNYRLQKKTKYGEIVHETTLVRTGGASNGSTTIAWKMIGNTSAAWKSASLDTPEIVRWNETTGSSITVTVEILHDSATNLTDKEIWLECQYLGTSGVPLGSFVNDAAATYLTSAADQTTSSETWTTTGMSNPNKQKLAVSFTPQEKGYIHAVVKLAKASYTVYVDPMITVS